MTGLKLYCVFVCFSCVAHKITPSATITSDPGCDASTIAEMTPASTSRISSSTITSVEGSGFATNLSMPVATFSRNGSGFASTITRLPSSTIVRDPGVQEASKTGVLIGFVFFRILSLIEGRNCNNWWKSLMLFLWSRISLMCNFVFL